jgi:O-methyltransferase
MSVERLLSSMAARAGLTVCRTKSLAERLPIEATPEDRRVIDSVRPYTMTGAERIWCLLQSVAYLTHEGIPGDFVECGVWRGGSVMAMCLRLRELGVDDRRIWLYDTFEGMTSPTSRDVESGSGRLARDMLNATPVGDGDNVWAVSPVDEVRTNVASTGYPMSQLAFVAGDVTSTLQEQAPEQIAMLRVDTDWYESTKASLEVLYPRLAVGGVCILDDYGHWEGARHAVDDYFDEAGQRPLILPIDYSGRVLVKNR